MRWPAVAVVVIALAALGPVAPVTAAPEDGPTPWLGVTYKPNPWGAVLITEVHPGGPAASAGLRSGDMLHALDGTPILDLGEQIRAAGLGARIRLTLERDGRAVVLRVRLAARPSPDELVHLALHGRALPRLPAVDGVGQPVRALAVRGAPTAVALFDARCATVRRAGEPAGVVVADRRAPGPRGRPGRQRRGVRRPAGRDPDGGQPRLGSAAGRGRAHLHARPHGRWRADRGRRRRGDPVRGRGR
jgi:membrane-associated protease RseP (regulator of RpoE activity)